MRAARRSNLTIDDSDEDNSDEDYGIATLVRATFVGARLCPTAGPGTGPHHAEEVKGWEMGETVRQLAVSVSRCHSLGHVEYTSGPDATERELAMSVIVV